MAFRGYWSGVSVFCLLTVAGLLPSTPSSYGQTLELRGTIDESAVLPGLVPPEPDPIETGAIGGGPYEPFSSGALWPDEELAADHSIDLSGDRPARRNNEPDTQVTPSLSSDSATAGSRMNTRAEPTEPVTGRQNPRAAALQGGMLRRDDDPHAPIGLRAGTFNLFPSLEQGVRASTNGTSSPGGRSATFSETTLRLSASSDWSRHALDFNGNLTYEGALSGDAESELKGNAEVALRVDISRSVTGHASIAYLAERESFNSPHAVAGVDKQPLQHEITGTAAIEKSLGPLRLTAGGRIVRETFGPARLDDGTTFPQSDRNSTLALATLRAGYELSPTLVPFVEIEGGRRNYDQKTDSAGYKRSSRRYGARAGVQFDRGEKLRGEISAGWIAEDFDDDRLRRLAGLALAASIQWSPIRGTNVFFDASTNLEDGSGGDSGSLRYLASLRVERQMRANLTGSLEFGGAWRDYEAGGHDLTLHGEASLAWWLNRYAALVTRLRYERQTSSDPSREYDGTSIYVGMKLQR